MSSWAGGNSQQAYVIEIYYRDGGMEVKEVLASSTQEVVERYEVDGDCVMIVAVNELEE